MGGEVSQELSESRWRVQQGEEQDHVSVVRAGSHIIEEVVGLLRLACR